MVRASVRVLRPLLDRVVPRCRGRPTPARRRFRSGARPHRRRHRRRAGRVLALPHLGRWEWAAFWPTRVARVAHHRGGRAARAARAGCWFTELRAELASTSSPGPAPARPAPRAPPTPSSACSRDRDLRRRRGGRVLRRAHHAAGGPATLALRSGAALIPSTSTSTGDGAPGASPPALDTDPAGPLRDDVARVTQDLAHELQDLIRGRPSSGTCSSPTGRATTPAPAPPGPRPAAGDRLLVAVRIGLVCPYSLTVPGGVQAQVLGPGPRPARRGPRRPGPGPVRRPAARRRRDAARATASHRRQRLGRPAGPRPAAQLRPIRAPARRGLRRPPPPRAARARARP